MCSKDIPTELRYLEHKKSTPIFIFILTLKCIKNVKIKISSVPPFWPDSPPTVNKLLHFDIPGPNVMITIYQRQPPQHRHQTLPPPWSSGASVKWSSREQISFEKNYFLSPPPSLHAPHRPLIGPNSHLIFTNKWSPRNAERSFYWRVFAARLRSPARGGSAAAPFIVVMDLGAGYIWKMPQC